MGQSEGLKQRLQNTQKKWVNRGMVPSYSSIHALQRDVILEIRQFISACGNWSHSFTNTVFSSWMVLGGGVASCIRSLQSVADMLYRVKV